MRTLTMLFICLVSWPAFALDQTVGTATTCKIWLEERDKLATWVHSQHHQTGEGMPKGSLIPDAWLIGFLEGYDWGCPKDKPRTAGLDTEAVFERLDRICKAGAPDTALLLAALNLIKQFSPEDPEGICTH